MTDMANSANREASANPSTGRESRVPRKVGLEGCPRSLAEVEEALVECHALWWRSPGEGHWPFAGDGPWNLAQSEVGDFAGDYSETLVQTDSGKVMQVRKMDSRRPRPPLDAAEVDRRDAVTAWLQWVPDMLDRRLLHAATAALHREEARIPWKALKRWLGWDRSHSALAFRYARGLATIACRLNGWPERRISTLAVEGVKRGEAER